MLLGKGSYGEVTVKDGSAVKKFGKLSHLIQEYVALKYLQDCKYVVHCNNVDFSALELHMELYDCSLRKYFEENENIKVLPIIYDILKGLVELHDRDLAHGDIKPGNILVNKQPFKIVLGDCGFVSIAKYAKVERTAAVYRDPIVDHDSSHDMFSFGICFLEMVGGIKINRQATYHELRQIVHDKVENKEYQKIIYSLLQEDKHLRPTARSLLQLLFKEDPPKWVRPDLFNDSESVYLSVPPEQRRYIRKLMKTTGHKFNINRAKKGYGALISYIDKNNVSANYYDIYTLVTLMVLSSIFGQARFDQHDVLSLCNSRYNLRFIYSVLENILSDYTYINILLAP